MKKGILLLLSITAVLSFFSPHVNAASVSGSIPTKPLGFPGGANSPGSSNNSSSGSNAGAFNSSGGTNTSSTNTGTTINSSNISPPGLKEPNSQSTGWPTTTPVTKYAGVSVPTTSLSNENYSTLPTCPAASAVACPDINGNAPAGVTVTAASCPDSCIVNRIVNTTPGNPNDILSTVPAFCPPGYSSVAVYKEGQEIGRTATAQAAPYPIPNMATYNNYISLGYTCTNQFIARSTAALCLNTDTVDGSVQMVTAASIIASSNALAYGYSDYVGIYGISINPANDQTCYASGSGCFNNLFIVSCSTTPHMRYFPALAYAYKQCTLPAGKLYYTGNTVPVGLVCTRVKPTWTSS